MSSRRPVALTPPDRIFAEIGRTTAITLYLTELSGVSRDVIVRALGNLSGPLPARQLRLEAGATVEVDIDVAIPHGMPPGQHNFLFEVVDRDTGSVIDSLETSVDVQHTKAIRMHVSPASIRRRRRGRIRIIVRNHDEETQHIRLRAETDDPETDVRLEMPDVSVRPGELVRVSGRVKAKPFYIGKQKERWYSIIGEGAGTPIYTRGNVRQMPMIGKNIKGVMVLLTILMVWAGSTLAIIRAISPATSEVTAGATSGPADPDAGGDQDGAGAAGAEPILVDVTGTVTAVPDGSGVVVTWRTVSLGDAAAGKVSAGSSTESPDVALQQTETDGAGAFVVPGIDALGLYEFSFFKAGHQTKTLIVQPNGQPVTLEVALEAGSGFIGGATVDASGSPLGGVDVTLTDGAITYSLSTPTSGDSAGRFSFANLSSPATYVLDARVAGRGLASTTIELDTGQSIGDVRLDLSPDVATLAGKITAAAFESGSTAAADFRVAQDAVADFGPTFTITATDGSLTRSTTTLTEGLLAGTFRLEQLPVGRTYTITYEAPGFQTLTEQIELTLSTPEREISMVRSTGRLRGKVSITGSSLSPTAVAVTVTNPDNTYKTTDAISSDGSLLVDGIVPGAYVVVFEALGLEKQVREVDIGAGTSTVLDVTLAATRESPVKSSLSFKVVKGGNDTTTAVTATLKFRAAGDCGAVGADVDCTYDVNLSDGNITITGLEAGGYVVDFTATGFAPRRISAQVAASTDAPQQEVLMVPLGSLQGLVADETSAPIQGLQLGLYLESTLIASTTTSATGEYLFSRKLLPDTYAVRVTGSGFLPVERSVVGALAATLNLDITVRGKSLITGEIRSLDLLTGNYVAVEPRDYSVFIRQNKAPSNNQWVDAATLGVAETLGAYRMALEPTQDPDAQPVLNDPPYDLCVVIVTQPDTALASTACDQVVVGLTARVSQAIDIELGETLTRSFYFSPDPGSVSGVVTVGGVAKGGVKVEARRIDETGRVLESSSVLTEDGVVAQGDPAEVIGRFVFSALTPVKALPTPAPPPGTAVGDETTCTFTSGASCWIVRASEEGTGFADSPQMTVYPARSISLPSPINIVKAGGTYNVTFTDDRGETLIGVSAIVYRKSSPPGGYDKNSWDGTCGLLPNCAVSSQGSPIISFPGLDPAEYVLDARFADYRDLSVTFNITQGGVVDQVQKLVATKGNLLIDVRNASGSPIGGAQVWIGASFAASAYRCETNTADDTPIVGAAEGTCSITGIPEGVKTLSIDASGSPRGTIVATVIGGQTIGAAAVLGSTQAVVRVATFTSSGALLDGVTVTVDGQPAATCVTDQSGQCEIPGLAAGSFIRIIGSKTNYRNASASLAVGSGTTGVSLALVPTRTLTITVTGNGAALENASVTAVDGNGDTYSCAPPGTDASGECSVDNLPLGNVVVTASLAGWVTTSETVGITSAATAALAIDLVPLVATLRGVVSAGGSGVPGAIVSARSDFGTVSTTSDSSGNYVFASISAGTWTISVSAVGFDLLTVANVSVVASQTTTQNLSLTALGGSLTLTARTSSGSPIEGLTIELSQNGTVTHSLTASVASPHVYSASSIAAGQYVVTITDPNSRYASQSFVVNIERGYATSLPIYLGTTRSVLVIAIAAIPASGFGPQTPLDVKVRATGPGNVSSIVRTVSRLDRSVATFTDLVAGSYTIEIDDQNLADLTQFTARTEIVVGAQPSSTYSVGSPPTVEVLQATTNDAGLLLVPRATVDVNVPVNENGSAVQLSDGYLLSPTSSVSANGSATLASIPPGTYTLTVSKSGFTTYSASVTVADRSAATNGVVTLGGVTLSTSNEPGTLTATVTDNANPASNLAGATVLVVETGQSCTSSATGSCTIVTPPGSYTVRASHPGHSSQTSAGSIVVSPGLETTTSFALSPSTATVEFTVTDGSNPLTAAQIREVTSGTTGTTDASGVATFSGLAATESFFEISKTGHATVHVAIRPVAGETRSITVRLTPLPVSTNTLSVEVVNARTGAPLEGVAVTRTDDSALCSSVTSAQGTCAPAAALATGSLTIKAAKAGFVTARTTVSITAESATHVVIALHPSTAVLDIRVRDARDGALLSGVAVSYTGSSGTHCNGTHPDTNANGLCEIIALSSGALTITLSKTDYATATAVISLEPGQRHSVDIALAPRGSLAITLASAATADTTFTIVGTALNCVIANAGSTCTINHIPTGTWILRASATHADRTVGIDKGTNTVTIP